MELDDNNDGLVTWQEVMQVVRWRQTGLDEQWTIWPKHVFIQLKRGMMDSVPIHGENPAPGYRARINPKTGSVAIVGNISEVLDFEGDTKTDVDGLMDKLQ